MDRLGCYERYQHGVKYAQVEGGVVVGTFFIGMFANKGRLHNVQCWMLPKRFCKRNVRKYLAIVILGMLGVVCGRCPGNASNTRNASRTCAVRRGIARGVCVHRTHGGKVGKRVFMRGKKLNRNIAILHIAAKICT